MAKPIKITPVLSGKSSRRFNEMLEKESGDKATAQEKKKIFSLVEKVLANQK
jgi:hypothetical protein